MKCKLCKEKEANKKNTHYLTDGIIRKCLNQDGSNERDKGYYWEMDSSTPFIDFNFQRRTSVPKLEEELGRKPTEEEIEKAKEIPFSVDFVFCSECEDIFTSIETPFIEKILPDFRSSNLSDIDKKCYSDDIAKLFKLFIYLQVYRTAICEDNFNLKEEILEELRLVILKSEDEDLDIPNFPVLINYLETTGDEKAYTENFVGTTNDRNPNIIFLCDFTIQFFESEDDIKRIEFYGLNEYDDFEDYINYNNGEYSIKITSNDKRKEILNSIHRDEKAKKSLAYFEHSFSVIWCSIFGSFPNRYIIQEYLNYLTSGDFNILNYTRDTVETKTRNFIESKVR